MIKYEVIMYWSDEDQSYIAEVPELPGCAADGATYQEALTIDICISNRNKLTWFHETPWDPSTA